MLKKFLLLCMVVSFAVVGTAAALAEESDDADEEEDVVAAVDSEDYGSVWIFTDGRLNSGDLDAPVAIYYTYDKQMVLDDNGSIVWGVDGYPYYEDVVTGLELLAIDDQGNGQALMVLPKDIINNALSKGQTSFSAGGYTLNIGENGWYWVVSPPDDEGKTYTFSWEDLGRTIDQALVTAG